MMYGYGSGYGNDFMGGGMIFMMFFGLIIIAAVIYFVIKSNSSHTNNQHYAYNNINSGRAMDILNEKFANGEISEDEYNSKKNFINSR